MAKKKKSKKARANTRAARSAPPPPGPPIIEVPSGGTATVIVEVGPMTVQYAVSYAGNTVFTSLVDRAVPLPLQPGEQVLGWAFTHMVKEWHHTIAVSVNGDPPIVLESLSEKNKDQDVSVNFATVRTKGGA